MIEVIYYCSYTGSPVGFVMGKLMYNSNQHENYVLSTEFGLIDPTIRKCFENGMFHAAIGVLPNNGSNLYFLLIKKLLSKGKTETAPDNYYLDLAIITKNKNTFSQWIKNGSSPQEIADAIRDTMEIDGHNDNGFTVRPHELNNLLDKSFGTLFHGAEFSLDSGEFAIRTTFGDPDPDDLAEGLNLSNRTWHFTISKFDKKWAIYHKKQKIWDKKPYRNRLSDDEFQNIVNRKTNEELQDDIDSIKNDIDDISNSSDGSIPPQKKQSWLRALWENLKRLIRYLKEKLMNVGRSLGIIRESLDDLSSDVYCYLTEDTDMIVTNNGQTLTSAIVNEIGGQTPEQLYAWMHKNISYDKSLKTWHLKSAAELYQTKTGNCHDQSYFETFLLHSWGYVTGQLYFVEFSDSSPIGGNTHTLTWYKDDQMKYHWIENAWENYAGIHGPYDSINDLKDAVLDAYLKDNDINQGKMDGIVFGTFSSYRLGMNLNQYARSWKLTDDRRINTVNESVEELLDWIDRFVHDDEFRESYFVEGSHGKLKYDFRMGWNYNTGHQIKIVYSLDGINVTNVGDFYWKHNKRNRNSDGSLKMSENEYKDWVAKNIRRKGNNDHESVEQKVLAIEDIVTGKRLNSVTLISPICPALNTRVTTQTQETLNEIHQNREIYQQYISNVSAGSIDTTPSFKATKWFSRVTDPENGQNLRFNKIAKAELEKHGRGVKIDNIQAKDFRVFGDDGKYMIYHNPNRKQALNELRMREADIINYITHIRQHADMSDPENQELYVREIKNLQIIRRDINRIEHGKQYDLSMMKKYRQYDEGVSAGLTGKQLWHYYTYMDFRPSSTCIEDTDVMIDDRIMDILSEKKNDGLIDKIFRFHEYMGNFKYGLAIDGVIDKTRNTTSADYDNLYRVVGPKDFEKQGGGICWDFVTYQADYFKKHFKDIDYTTWYIVFDAAPDYPSHTFMTFKFNDQYIYFESSFKGNNDIWVAPSEDDIINFVMDSMDKHTSYHKGKLIGCKYYITKYNALDKRIPGCSCDEFMELMKTYNSEVKHSFKKSYNVSKFQPSTAVYESEEVNKDPEDEHKPESKPKQVDKAESDKNGVRRKKLYIAFIEWCKEINPKNTFGSIFDKDAFHVTYPFVPEEMRYFYRLANPMLCVLQGNLTFFAAAELRKLNSKNSQLQQMMIFAATENDFRVFNNKDKKVYRGIDKNGALTLQEVLGETFDLYIQNMIKKGDILNAPLEESVEEYAMIE